MNNLIIAQNYETFGDEGLTSNKVIYYKEDNMVKFRANITDNPYGESEVVTIGGSGIDAVLAGQTDTWYAPSNLTTIRQYLFYSDTNIDKIYSTGLRRIETHAFESSSISSINGDGVIDLTGFTYLGNSAFRGCTKVTNVILPTNMSIIDAHVFRGTKITSIDIPNAVTTIRTYAFSTSTLKTINFGNTRTTIPTIVADSFVVNEDTKFIVPDALVEDWKAASVWSNYAANIFAYSEVIPVYYTALKNTNLTKIDTGISANNATRIEYKLWSNRIDSFYSLGTRTGTSGSNIFSLSGSSSSRNVLISVSGTSKALSGLTRNASGYTYEGFIETNGDMTFSYALDNGSIVRSESNISYPNTLADNNLHIFLFSNGFNNIGATLKFYYVRIYQDGELVRDFRPATLNNVSGLYDEVTQTLFTASNLEVE